jgi:hypothetical protein
MLCGTPPHEGDTVESVLDAARSGSRAPLGLLAPAAPRALVSAIEQALQADTALRPDALAFASALRRSHAAAPVRLADREPVAAPSEAPRVTDVLPQAPPVAVPVAGAGRRRKLGIAAAALGVLAVAAVAGWLSGRSGAVQLASVAAATPAAVPAASTAVTPPPSWTSILDGLDRVRAQAFAEGNPAGLAGVYVPGSALLTTDRDVVARLAAAGRRARGVRHAVRTLSVLSVDDRAVVLRVVDELAAYDVVDASGRVVQQTAGRGRAAFIVRLVRTPAGWRLAGIRPA